MTTKAAVIGDPVAHSLSPAMHNAAYEELGLDWNYGAVRVRAEDFEDDLRDLVEQGYAGVNVTIPHKLRALAIADRASASAQAIGAANTLIFKEGEIYADNTDASGFIDALHSVSLRDLNRVESLLLGAGGTARAAVWALMDQGSGMLSLWNRTGQRAHELKRSLPEQLDRSKLEVISEPDSVAGEATLIVNTTSAGLDGEPLEQLRLSAEHFHKGQVVVDFVYHPGGTELINCAKQRGATCIDGYDLLLYQGARSFELFTGSKAPLDVMRRAITRR